MLRSKRASFCVLVQRSMDGAGSRIDAMQLMRYDTLDPRSSLILARKSTRSQVLDEKHNQLDWNVIGAANGRSNIPTVAPSLYGYLNTTASSRGLRGLQTPGLAHQIEAITTFSDKVVRVTETVVLQV